MFTYDFLSINIKCNNFLVNYKINLIFSLRINKNFIVTFFKQHPWFYLEYLCMKKPTLYNNETIIVIIVDAKPIVSFLIMIPKKEIQKPIKITIE